MIHGIGVDAFRKVSKARSGEGSTLRFMGIKLYGDTFTDNPSKTFKTEGIPCLIPYAVALTYMDSNGIRRIAAGILKKRKKGA